MQGAVTQDDEVEQSQMARRSQQISAGSASETVDQPLPIRAAVPPSYRPRAGLIETLDRAAQSVSLAAAVIGFHKISTLVDSEMGVWTGQPVTNDRNATEDRRL